MLLLAVLVPETRLFMEEFRCIHHPQKKQDFLNSRDQFIQQTGLERTYWKLLGSPAFQFSYVIGLPVDIQKNLEEYNYGNRVRLGHNLAVKRVLLIETKKPTCSPPLGQCHWSRSAHGPFLKGDKLRIQKKMT